MDLIRAVALKFAREYQALGGEPTDVGFIDGPHYRAVLHAEHPEDGREVEVVVAPDGDAAAHVLVRVDCPRTGQRWHADGKVQGRPVGHQWALSGLEPLVNAAAGWMT